MNTRIIILCFISLQLVSGSAFSAEPSASRWREIARNSFARTSLGWWERENEAFLKASGNTNKIWKYWYVKDEVIAYGVGAPETLSVERHKMMAVRVYLKGEARLIDSGRLVSTDDRCGTALTMYDEELDEIKFVNTYDAKKYWHDCDAPIEEFKRTFKIKDVMQ